LSGLKNIQWILIAYDITVLYQKSRIHSWSTAQGLSGIISCSKPYVTRW